ncbi:MAG: T9SS type A sorting domain-containing protein [Chitinophagales bacterium]|nr:T9SS type A sorting domain-containing protein [Chitinophagales bacterium]
MKRIKKYMHTPGKDSLSQKLAAYSALAAGTAAALMPNEAEAKIVYTDECPDVNIQISGFAFGFFIDNDTVEDFKLSVQQGMYAGTYDYGLAAIFTPPGNAIAGDTYTTGGYSIPTPFALNAGDTIKSTLTFNNSTGATAPQYLGFDLGGLVSVGNWISATDKYIGIKFQINGQTHYGWIRLDVQVTPTTPIIRIKDYAYEDVPNTPIVAGAMPAAASGVTGIVPSDVADNNNGTDLKVDFVKASNESTISEYRIIVVKDANASGFDLCGATSTPTANYTAVAPTGANVSQILASGARDANGDPITNGVPYRIFVLSLADGTNAGVSTLSGPSASITLSNAAAVPAVSNVVATDIGNSNNGTDLQVSFTKAINETNISAYRIIVVKNANAGSFNLVAANAIIAANYTSVTPTGSNIQTALGSTAKDSDGDPIQNGTPYKVFVLSVANGTGSTVNALSLPSNQITLTTAVSASLATNVSALDVANNNNGLDLQVAFTKAAAENTISEYRILVVKAANAGSFNLGLANTVGMANYTAVIPNGSNISQVLTASSKDVDGDAIVNGTPYNVFVLSVADGIIATINSLSAPSNQITLSTAISAPQVTGITATDVANNKNGSDLQVAFNKVTDETQVDEYRIFVVKSAASGTFDLTAANALGTAFYNAFTPNGNNVQLNLTPTSVDVDGDTLVENQAYKVFVLSVADGVNATTNTLSTASNEVTLTSPSAIAENTLQGVRMYGFGNAVRVKFDQQLFGTASLKVLNMLGQVVFAANLESQDNTFELNVSNGYYLLQVTSDSKVANGKVFISK